MEFSLVISFGILTAYLLKWRTELSNPQKWQILKYGLLIGLLPSFSDSFLDILIFCVLYVGGFCVVLEVLSKIFGQFPFSPSETKVSQQPRGLNSRVFLSHSSKDKPTVHMLAAHLQKIGYTVWFDVWEMRSGDTITETLEGALDRSGFVIIALSAASVESAWVDREWRYKYQEDLEINRVSLLPIIIEDCAIPEMLKDKRFSDFRDDYASGLADLVRSMSVIEGQRALNPLEFVERAIGRPAFVWGGTLLGLLVWAGILGVGDPHHYADFWVLINHIAIIPIVTMVISFIRPIWLPVSVGHVILAHGLTFFATAFLIMNRADVNMFGISKDPKKIMPQVIAVICNCVVVGVINWLLRKRRL